MWGPTHGPQPSGHVPSARGPWQIVMRLLSSSSRARSTHTLGPVEQSGSGRRRLRPRRDGAPRGAPETSGRRYGCRNLGGWEMFALHALGATSTPTTASAVRACSSGLRRTTAAKTGTTPSPGNADGANAQRRTASTIVLRQQRHRLRTKVKPKQPAPADADPWQLAIDALEELRWLRWWARSDSKALGRIEQVEEGLKRIAWGPSEP